MVRSDLPIADPISRRKSGFRMSAPGTKRHGRVLLAVGLLVSAVAFARPDDFWKRKPASEWTVEEALKLVQDSPWARKQAVTVLRRQSQADLSLDVGGAECDPDAIDSNGNCLQRRPSLPLDASQRREVAPTNFVSATILVRWESAASVVQAFARLAELGARASAAFQAPPPRLPSDRYVVTIKVLDPRGLGGDPFAGAGGGKGKSGAWLKTAHGTVAPLEAERSGVGAAAAMHFFFPRTQNDKPLLGAQRETVEFSFQGERFALKTKFTVDVASLR